MSTQTMTKDMEPVFHLGQVMVTPGAREAVPALGDLLIMLARHQSGDYGHVCGDDWRVNDMALKDGSRIMSAYAIDESRPCAGFGENTIWVITEADRSVTTLLLPEEY